MSTYNLLVQRATSMSGAAWVKIVHDGGIVWLLAQAVSQSRSKVGRLLAEHGLHLDGRDELNSFFQHLRSAGICGEAPPIDRSGWQGPYFAMPDKWVFCPDSRVAGPVIFPTRFNRPAYAGTTTGWQEGVGELIKGQSLPMFMVQAALAAPLRAVTDPSRDILFEIIAPSQSDLTLLATTAFSATGVVSSSAATGAIPFSRALADDATYRREYADLLLVTTGADFAMAPESAARRAMNLRELLCNSAEVDSPPTPMSTVLLGSRSLTEVVGAETEIGHEVARRSMCMKVLNDAPFGVLDRLPVGISDATEYAARLNEGAQQQHGRVVGRFIEKLVHERATEPARLKAEVNCHITSFVERCHVNRNDTDATQVASDFGLIYAAGALARAWHVLPGDWRCGVAVLNSYRRLITAPVVQRSFSAILDELVLSADTIHYGVGQPTPSRVAVASAMVLVHHTQEGQQLLIRKEAVANVIPHWSSRMNMPEVRAAMITDGQHLAPKRRLPGQTSTRIYVFKIRP